VPTSVTIEVLQPLLASVLEVPISQGAIQKVIERVSRNIEPYYEAIQEAARSSLIDRISAQFKNSWAKKSQNNDDL